MRRPCLYFYSVLMKFRTFTQKRIEATCSTSIFFSSCAVWLSMRRKFALWAPPTSSASKDTGRARRASRNFSYHKWLFSFSACKPNRIDPLHKKQGVRQTHINFLASTVLIEKSLSPFYRRSSSDFSHALTSSSSSLT